MTRAIIVRQRRSSQGTEGVMIAPGFTCFTMELNWHDNKTGKSCIPAGKYRCKLVRTPKHGLVFMLVGVPGRFSILIHSGNVAGDIDQGWKTHSQGCLLLGKFRGFSQGQRAVLVSKLTVAAMMDVMGTEFDLEIKEAA